MGATAEYELDTEFSKDAQAIYERSLQINKVDHTSTLYCATLTHT